MGSIFEMYRKQFETLFIRQKTDIFSLTIARRRQLIVAAALLICFVWVSFRVSSATLYCRAR